jgi:hypothetical protein
LTTSFAVSDDFWEDKEMQRHYSVVGLQEPGGMNVLSLEQKTLVGNILRFEETGQQYRVVCCEDPLPTEFDAACLAINGRVSLRVALNRR